MSFSSIVGHKEVIEALKRAIQSERIGQAYLFSGPEGIGKRLVALSFAKALNCEEGGGDFCGSCRSCRKIEEGNHPDVLSIAPQGRFIRIDQTRDLQGFLRLRPVEARWKVAIIDGAERMNTYAANSLLKTLEEPSSRRVIILVAGRGGVIPPTLVSRCQKVRFSPLKEGEVLTWLKEHLGIPEEEARLKARFCKGSIKRALEIDGKGLRDGQKEMVERLKRVLEGDRGSLFEWAEAFSNVKDSDGYMDLVKHLLRDVIVYKATEREDLLFHRDLVGDIKGLAALVSLGDLVSLWERAESLHRDLYNNINRQLGFEWMLLGG